MSLRMVVIVLTGALASGCSWQEPASVAQPSAQSSGTTPETTPRSGPRPRGQVANSARSDHGLVAATVAQQQIGVRYQYGGADESGFDCSGLVQFAYRHAGISTPRTTQQLWRAVVAVPETDVRPGDVLFFDIGGKPSHVGIYVGDGFFVHAPSTGRTVSRERMSTDFYSRSLIRVGRFNP